MKRNRKRLAAIDIGTNSIRCIVVEAASGDQFRVLDDEKASVRIGRNLAEGGKISTDAWQRAIETLLRMKQIADGYGVEVVEAVATSALRRAANGEAFIRELEARTGIRAVVISGEEEARLVSLSVLHNFDLEAMRYAMMDIGGGSLEIVTALGSHIEEFYSLELGAVTLTERFISRDPVTREDYRKLLKHVRTELRNAFDREEMKAQCIVGSGGTVTSLASMIMAMRREGYDSVHGYEVLRSDIVHLLAMLLRKDLKERKEVPGLNPDRADIIIAGVTVIDELMRLFGANVLKVNERGIREGLILDSLRKHELLSGKIRRRDWRSVAREFARSCLIDEEHARQVTMLSLKIFDDLGPAFNLGERERRLLETAAMLHDTGYFISYTSHHKHSYHLIRHADLFGFTPREREIVANVARYHRKSLPKKKHEGFSRLTEQDRTLVARLGGILRLADGLDRRRNSMVRNLGCDLSENACRIFLESDCDLSVEIYGGKAKGDLFENAFQRKLILTPA